MSDFSNFPDDSVRVTEEASTFTESDITVISSQAEVSNGSVKISSPTSVISDFEDGTITTTSGDWDGWKGDTGNLTVQTGTVIDGNETGELTASNGTASVAADSGTNITDPLRFKVEIDNESTNDTDGVTVGISTAGESSALLDIFWEDSGSLREDFSGTTLLSDWSTGVTYFIELLPDFANDTVDVYVDGTLEAQNVPLLNSSSGWGYIEVLNQTVNSGITRNVFIDSFEEFAIALSGNALIKWDSGVPADIKSWDLTTFQNTLDGETVTVDVEDSNGNVLESDISEDTDISDLATSTDVQLRANLSRNDRANNPTVDYLARRFTR